MVQHQQREKKKWNEIVVAENYIIISYLSPIFYVCVRRTHKMMIAILPATTLSAFWCSLSAHTTHKIHIRWRDALHTRVQQKVYIMRRFVFKFCAIFPWLKLSVIRNLGSYAPLLRIKRENRQEWIKTENVLWKDFSDVDPTSMNRCGLSTVGSSLNERTRMGNQMRHRFRYSIFTRPIHSQGIVMPNMHFVTIVIQCTLEWTRTSIFVLQHHSLSLSLFLAFPHSFFLLSHCRFRVPIAVHLPPARQFLRTNEQ